MGPTVEEMQTPWNAVYGTVCMADRIQYTPSPSLLCTMGVTTAQDGSFLAPLL